MSAAASCDLTRLPVGHTGFSSIRKRGIVYVDKTAVLAGLAAYSGPLFFSRPERFGKTLLIDTLECLFSRGPEDFHGLAIEGLWKDTTYPVVRLDFSEMKVKDPEILKGKLTNRLVRSFGVAGKVSPVSADGKYRFPDEVLGEIASGLEDSSVVLLIDEYDAPLMYTMETSHILQSVIEVLNNFYSAVQEYQKKFRFIFITGVTRAADDSIFTSFRSLRDISLEPEYNTLLGFTKDEIVRYFDMYVENAAQSSGTTKEYICSMLKHQYDGYQFAIDAEETLYNPWSVLRYLQTTQKGFWSYWTESVPQPSLIYSFLKVRNGYDFIRYDDRKIAVIAPTLSRRYEITSIQRAVLLYQKGYLTLHRDNGGTLRLIPSSEEVENTLLELYVKINNMAIPKESPGLY